MSRRHRIWISLPSSDSLFKFEILCGYKWNPRGQILIGLISLSSAGEMTCEGVGGKTVQDSLMYSG